MKIPFNRQVRLDSHPEVIEKALASGHLSGNGPFTKLCESKLQELTGSPNILVSSATHALEMMAHLLDIAPGDEVIVPSFTFVSTANAFALRGARIRFADNDEYGQILPSEIERLSNEKTKAVVVVHYAGNSPNMRDIVAVCQRLGIVLLEDAAQAIGSKFEGKPLGTFGALGCFSFHETKNICSGEGGSLIVNDPSLFDRAEIIRDKGTNRRKFLQGLADKYTWVDIGSSYLVSDLNAAYLLPQLESLDTIRARRGEISAAYEEAFTSDLVAIDAHPLRNPKHNFCNYHIFGIVFFSRTHRDAYISFMRDAGVVTPFHYIPLHTSPFGAKYYDGGNPESLTGCERISGCLVRLPVFYNMRDAELEHVISATKDWIKRL